MAALLAIFTAYLRTMGAAAGAGQVFAGVMAKPQRMFFVTLLCLFQALAPSGWLELRPLGGLGAAGLTLTLIVVGCVVTSMSRLSTISSQLRRQ